MTERKAKETTLTFTGDIGFDKYMANRWKDEDLLDKEVLAFLRDTDHLIVNVEGPLSDGSSAPDAGNKPAGMAATLKHSMDPGVADWLRDCLGADIWNICNNHIMDDGAVGMEDTLRAAGEHGALTLGAGMNIGEAKKPVILDEAGGIGMIGVGYQRACRKASEDVPGCLSWSDMDTIREQIEFIKKTCRWCIIVAHGGEEFTALPSPYTRDRYHEYLKMGADIVVSHHPHVPMNYETVRNEEAVAISEPGVNIEQADENKIIFYSLGNFVFDTDYQRSQFNTEYGIFVKLIFTEESFRWEPFGIRVDREKERIVKDELPKIFEDVNEEEYELLEPLAAKMFIENTKKQLKYLYPDKFRNATEQDFIDNFYEPLRSGRVPGEVLDMQIMYPLSLRESEREWEESSLEGVKEFILKQIKGERI